MKKSRRFAAILALCGALSIAIVSTTYAAFVIKEVYSQKISVKLNYKEYFGGGTGTSADPYIINDFQQLKNLSNLTSLGCFSRNDYFELGADISNGTGATYNDFILPIGNIDTPFYGHFDGKGHTITNLKVEASNVSDIGMFGYVANGAEIKNFLLVNPYVKGTGTYNGEVNKKYDYTKANLNPLRQFVTEAQLYACKIVPGETTADKRGFTTMTIEKPTDIKAPNSNETLTVRTESSNTALISHDGTIVNADQLKAYTGGSGYMTFEFFIEGLFDVSKDPAKHDFRLIRYVLERYKLFFDDTNDYFVLGASDAERYKKMINPDPSIDQEFYKVNNVMQAQDNTHTVYAGIVAGTLDGTATYIGVGTPKLEVVGLPFNSLNYMFGRKVDDDNHSNMSKEEFDLDKLSEEKNFTTPTYQGAYSVQNTSSTLMDNSFNDNNSQFITDIYGDDNTLNKGYITLDGKRIFRIYGDFDTVDPGITYDKIKYLPYKANTEIGTEYESTEKESTFISLNNFIDARTTGEETTLAELADGVSKKQNISNVDYSEGSLIFNSSKNGKSRAYLKNCIMIWATTEYKSAGFWGDLFSSGNDFYFNLEFDYLFKSNSTKDVELVVLGTRKNESLGNGTTFKKFLGNGYRLSTGYDYFDKNFSRYTQTNSNGEVIDNTTGDFSIVYDQFHNTNLNEKYKQARLFAIEGTNPLELTENLPDENGIISNKLRHKKIHIISNGKNWLEGIVEGQSIFDPLKSTHGNRTPLFAIGIRDKNYIANGATNTAASDFKLSIKNLELTVSSTMGNMQDNSTVEFLIEKATTPTFTAATKDKPESWSNWPLSSGVTIRTKLIKEVDKTTIKEITDPDNANQKLQTGNPLLTLPLVLSSGKTYTIQVNRTGSNNRYTTNINWNYPEAALKPTLYGKPLDTVTGI